MAGKVTINWNGKGYYKRFDDRTYGSEVRKVAWYENYAVPCASLTQVKREFAQGRTVDVFNYTALR